MLLPAFILGLIIGLLFGLVGYAQAENRAFRRFLNAEYRSTYVANRTAEDCQ